MLNRKLEYIIQGQKPLILPERDTVRHACRRMAQRRVGAVLVCDAKHCLVGIFTGRDAVRIVGEGRDPAHATLAEAMTRDPVVISPQCTAIDALRMMNDHGFRHLPVVDRGKVLGIVSRGDFKGEELERLDQETYLAERIW